MRIAVRAVAISPAKTIALVIALLVANPSWAQQVGVQKKPAPAEKGAPKVESELDAAKDILNALVALGKVFISTPADLVGRVKISLYLQGLAFQMAQIREAKQAVWLATGGPDCSQSEITQLDQIAKELKTDLINLDVKSNDLLGIAWTDQGAALRSVRDSINLLSIEHGKSWVPRLTRFCSLPENERRALRGEIKGTLDVSTRTVAQLDALIQKFRVTST